jgi:excisionase family DNA binding protein
MLSLSLRCLRRYPAQAPNDAICLRSAKFDGPFALLTVNTYMGTKSAPPHFALLKPSELAAQLGVSRSWLYDAAKAGRIPSIRIGGEEGPLRFVPEDIQRWIDDARAAWAPGRPTVPTRHPADIAKQRRVRDSRRLQTPASGQQSLL